MLREHLERLGVSSFWLRSALDAIHYCEQGDFFQPVFSVAGPAPARSVVALMRLEPFVRGEIDWTISPSESPFWVGSVGELQDELFDATASRFLDLYWSEHNPSVRPDLDAAFRDMVTFAEDELPEATPARNEDTRHHRWALGSAGYVWRVAESTARTSDSRPARRSREGSRSRCRILPERRARRAVPRLGGDGMRQPQLALRFGISRRLGGRGRVSAARIPLRRAARVFGGCRLCR